MKEAAFLTEVASFIKKSKLKPKEVFMSSNEQILIDFILNHFHWCPFSDDCGINFEQECVGFKEVGCKECILRNIEKLS